MFYSFLRWFSTGINFGEKGAGKEEWTGSIHTPLCSMGVHSGSRDLIPWVHSRVDVTVTERLWHFEYSVMRYYDTAWNSYRKRKSWRLR